MEIKKIQSIANNILTPVDYQKVSVDFGQGIVPGFAETYVSAMNAKLALRGSSIQFDAKELTKYLNLLLKLRIESVNGSGKTDFRAKDLKIPALYALSLTHVGYVYDKDLGIELMPVVEKLDVMTVDTALDFSRQKLSIVEDLGFELVVGLPRDRNGESNFMYFHMSEDKILRHSSEAHPGFAVLAAFFRLRQLQEVLTFRVNYGLVSEYDQMLKGLIYDEAR